MVNIAEQVVVM